ncbi:transposase [Bradyrhizobium sp. LM6.10]
MTFNAALRDDRISAPWVVAGPINGELFTLYRKVLAPTLAKREVVIVDKLGSHKRKARNAVRAAGAHVLFLPLYKARPHPFAKLKHLMRAAQRRDVEATWPTLGELLDVFSKEGMRQLFQESAYVSV